MEIECLFNRTRLQNMSTILMLMSLIYLPIGILLLLLRILMSFQYIVLFCLLPKKWFVRRILLRIYLFFIGIFVTCRGKKLKQDKSKVLVSNHVSHLDSIVIEAIEPSYRPAAQSIPDIISMIFHMGPNGDSPLPVSFFPEKESTNGGGLLKFNKEMFQKYTDKIIQPIVIMTNRPWFIPVNVHTLYGSFWTDLLWNMFLPYTQYHVSYMPATVIENINEDIDKLQKDMAFVLNIESTNITAQEKKEYIKRLRMEEIAEERRRQQEEERRQNNISSTPTSSLVGSPTRSSSRQNDRFDRMIEQVKNVLPQVPMKIIQIDISKTKNVDQTISNLLDGSIEYKPLDDEEQAKEKKEFEKMKKENVEKARKNKFGETTALRHLSFQERKKKMISDARRNYLERHPEFI